MVLKQTFSIFAGLCTAACAVVPAMAGIIPYPDKGTENPARYSFTANGGDIMAYFLGTGAAYDERLGLLVDGSPASPLIFENHQTAVGDSYDFGTFAKGSTLTFYIEVQQTAQTFYSNVSMNDDGAQHIYSTAYSGTSTIPAGTYVGFEDLNANRKLAPLQGYNVDYNYTDEQFSFTNLSMSVVPLPSSAPMFGAALVALGAVGYGLKRKAKAATA